MHNHQQVRRSFFCCHADPLHILRQAGKRLRYSVLNLYLRLVEIRAEAKRNRQRHHAVRRRLRKHVQHAFDAVDLLFERRCDRIGNHGRIRAGIRRAHHHRGRDYFGVLAQRQPEIRQRTDHEDHDGTNRGKNWAFNKKV